MPLLPGSGEELTIGLEEEIFLVNRRTGEPAPVAASLLSEIGGGAPFKLELPACQLEITTAPAASVADVAAQLASGRRELLAHAGPELAAIGCGVHPLAAPEGELNGGERYERLRRDYRAIAARQLVGALHVHVSLQGHERALAVYNAMRSHLPEIAALAANAPLQAGRDTGLASVRPVVCAMLPRQGVPPPLESWDAFRRELDWGVRAGAMPDSKAWWWELRPNLAFGTLEMRVPDTQISVRDSAAVAACVHCLAATLAWRFDAGARLPVHDSWRIAENRWSACRDGASGEMADLESGERVPTAQRLRALIDELALAARRLGCERELADARALCAEGGAVRQRRVSEAHGPQALVGWLADAFAGERVAQLAP